MAEKYRVTLVTSDFEATLFFNDKATRDAAATDLGRAMEREEAIETFDHAGTRVIVRGKDIAGVLVEADEHA